MPNPRRWILYEEFTASMPNASVMIKMFPLQKPWSIKKSWFRRRCYRSSGWMTSWILPAAGNRQPRYN